MVRFIWFHAFVRLHRRKLTRCPVLDVAGVILNLLDRVLVWPREIGVRLVPPSQSEEISAEEAFLQPPLGVLVVRVAGAKVEERRSTFLGRLKMPNPRLALIMPQVEGGTVQSGHTPAAQKTREPTWGQQFVFVVAQRGQNLRMLLSHKRMDMLWADMPLGAVEIPLEAVLAEAAPQAPRQPYQTPPRNANANAPYSGAPGPSAPASGGPWEGPSYPRDQARYRRGRSPSPALADVFDGYEDADADGYASATSSPRHSVSSGSGVAWASPVASMAIPEVTSPFSSVDPAQVYPLPSSPRRSLTPAFSGAATSQYWTRPLTPAPSGRADPVSASRGLSVILGDGAKRPSITQTRVISLPRTPSTMQDYQGHWAPPHSAQSMRRRESSLPTPHSVRAARNVTSSGWGASQSGEGEPLWLSPEGVWVEIPASGAVTMAGMVSDAVDAQPPVEPMPSLNAEENKGLLRTLQSLLLGNALGDDDEVEGSDEEAAGGSGTGASAGRIKLVMRWLPVEVARAPVVDLGKRGQQPSVQTTEVTQSKVGEQGPVKDNDRKSSEQQRQPTKKKSGKREARGAPAGGDSTSTGSGSSTPSAAGSAANLADRASGSNNAPAGPSPPVPRAMSVEPLPPKAGVLAIRVAYTKLDYGESPANPILALSLVPNPSASMSSVQAAAAAARDPLRRVITMQCEAGGRPGLLHWGRVFHLVVWDAASVRACLELGDASSSLKLNSYGTELYTMDACTSFEADVTVDARAWIPLKDVVSRGVVRGSWRLREARIVAGGVEMADSDRLDVGRAALLMAWYPFTAETLSSGDGVIA